LRTKETIQQKFDNEQMEKARMRDLRAKATRLVTYPDRWTGVLENGKHVHLEEDFVLENFGKEFLETMKKSEYGFVDIPCGDYKVSELDDYPHLQVEGAPIVKFVQESHERLCLVKSFASVLYNLGFYLEAEEILLWGKSEVQDNPCFILEKLRVKADLLLPRWIQSKKIPSNFNCFSDLEEGHILMGVIREKDGNISHGVSIHNNLIYDANEKVAIKLCNDGLDYCTRNKDGRESGFHSFWKGFIFYYAGGKPKRRKRLMMLS